jgi:hypothetical protein
MEDGPLCICAIAPTRSAMKRFIFLGIGSFFIFLLASAAWYTSKLDHNNKNEKPVLTAGDIGKTVMKKISTRAATAAAFAGAHRFNTGVCFMIDMSIESGSNRFFVYNLQKDSVEATGLVTHGNCNEKWLAGRKYGNSVGCGCTSLGKYKIGNAYKGKFGLAYKLHGLDSSNNNAFNRYVVLHAHGCVPEGEVKPYPICQSNGCPTVSPLFLQQLAKVIDASKQPILLWVYE